MDTRALLVKELKKDEILENLRLPYKETFITSYERTLQSTEKFHSEMEFIDQADTVVIADRKENYDYFEPSDDVRNSICTFMEIFHIKDEDRLVVNFNTFLNAHEYAQSAKDYFIPKVLLDINTKDGKNFLIVLDDINYRYDPMFYEDTLALHIDLDNFKDKYPEFKDFLNKVADTKESFSVTANLIIDFIEYKN